jgi:hypothetical protein
MKERMKCKRIVQIHKSFTLQEALVCLIPEGPRGCVCQVLLQGAFVKIHGSCARDAMIIGFNPIYYQGDNQDYPMLVLPV